MAIECDCDCDCDAVEPNEKTETPTGWLRLMAQIDACSAHSRAKVHLAQAGGTKETVNEENKSTMSNQVTLA